MRRVRFLAVLALLAALVTATGPMGADAAMSARGVVVPLRTIGRAATERDGGVVGEHEGAGPAATWPRATRRLPSSASLRTAARTPLVGGLDADLLGPTFPLSPGDPTGATGPTNVVAAVNVSVGVYDRTGSALMAPIRLRSINAALGRLHETDPKVVYDAYDDMFVLTFLTYNGVEGYIDVVTIPPATAADRSTWCLTHMLGDQVADGRHEFADYPSVGFTGDRVVVTTNNFGFHDGSFRYAQIVSMRKASLYDPTCSKPVRIRVLGGTATRNPDGSRAFTMQAAQSVGTPTAIQYLVSLETRRTSSALVLWRLRMHNGRLQLKKAALDVARVLLPPYGYQCGSTGNVNTWWDTGDLRLTSAFYDAAANRLYTATAVAGNAGGGPQESVIRWYEAQPRSSLAGSTVLRQGTIAAPDVDAAWPAVATSDAGTLFVTYARAGAGECLGMWAATVPAGAMVAQESLVHAGERRYEFSPGVERWGDFSAANRDPLVPADVAVFGAYARDTGSVRTISFRSHVALLSDV